MLEGIALVANPSFAIVDEAYPFISRLLLTDKSPRLRAALRYMIYGRGKTLDVDRLIDLLQALEKFVAVKDFGDGAAFKVGTYLYTYIPLTYLYSISQKHESHPSQTVPIYV